MKRKVSATDIYNILLKASSGTPVIEVCNQYHISASDYHGWCEKYRGMEAAEIELLNKLEQENSSLKVSISRILIEKERLLLELNKKSH